MKTGAEAPVEAVLELRSGLQLDFTRPPVLVEPQLERSVQAKDHEPAFAWNRLHPVVLPFRGCLGSEVDIHRAVRIDLDPLVLTADARGVLVGLHHRAGLVVIDDDRPEILHRDVRRQAQLVVLAAIERIA